MVRQAVGAPLQLRVAEGPVPRDHGGRIRSPRRLLREEVVDRGAGEVGRGGVPLPEHPGALAPVQQRHPGKAAGRVRGHGLQQHLQVAEHPLRRPGVEERLAVDQRPGQRLVAVLHRQVQVELGDPGAAAEALHLHRAEGEARVAPRRPLQRERRLEDGGVRQAPLGRNLLHQALEGELLVGVRPQHLLADPRQQLREGGIAAQLSAEREHVDEEADQPLQLHARATRDRAADHHVVLPRVAAQERLPRGQHRHERRGALAAAQLPHPLGRLPRERERDAPGAGARPGGARTVGGDFQQRGGPRQARLPPAELLLQHPPRQPLPLPDRVVHVPHRELRELRAPAAHRSRVEGGDLAHQHVHAPPVADDVVQREQQHVVLLAQPQQGAPQERAARQVEGAERLLLRQTLHLLLARDLHHLQRHRRVRVDHLYRLAARFREDRAQRLVPLHQCVQARPQRVRVQRAAQAQRVGHVVGGAPRLQPVHQPQPLLRERQRERPVPGGPSDRRAPLRASGAEGVHAGGQRAQRGSLEQGAERHLHARLPADAGDDLHGQERVAAEREEAVVRPHPLHAQHLRPHRGQHPLGAGPRLRVLPGARGVRGRERAPVGLAVGVQRQPLQEDEGGRHHVLREPLAEPRPQLRAREHGSLRGRRVRDQAHLAGDVLAGHHGRLPHPPVGEERGLHLPRLDAVAAHLDLLVHAPQELQLPRLQPPRPVPGPVHPPAGDPPERVGDEPLRGQLRLPQVAPRQLRPADAQLPGHSHRRGLPVRVQHVRGPPSHRPTDRDRGGPHAGAAGGHLEQRRGHHRFGRPVAVDQRHGPARDLLPRAHRRGLERLAADDHQPQARLQPGHRGAVAHELAPVRGRQVHRRHPEGADALRQLRGGPDLGVAHDHRRARHQRRQEVFQRLVEGERGEGQHPVRGRVPVRARDRPEVGRGGPVRDQHSLGEAGGAGGVDEVGRGVREGERGERRERSLVVPVRLQGEDAGPAGGEPPLQAGLRQHQGRAGVPQHVRQALGRRAGIEGEVDAPGPEDREQGGHHLGRVLGQHRDHGLRPDAVGEQPTGEPAARAVQLAEGERPAGGDQRGRLGRALRLRPEDLVHARTGGLRRGRVPLLQHPRPLRPSQEGHLRQPPPGDRQPFQYGFQVPHHPPRRPGADPAAVVLEVEIQLLLRKDDQRQRVVAPSQLPPPLHLEPVLAAADRDEDGVVLEDEDALEERELRGDLAPGVHAGERGLLVRARLHLPRLEPAEPLLHAGLRLHPQPQGEGVDEEPHHLVHALELRRPARRRDAEHHLVLARVPRQQQRPRALHHRVQRHPALPRQRAQARRGLRGEPVLHAVERRPVVRRALPGAVHAERGGRREPREGVPPERLGGGEVLPLQPRHVVAEGAPPGEGRLPPLEDRLVRGEDVLQHQRERPPVQEEVMVGPDQLEPVVRELRQPEPHQGGPQEVEVPLPLRLQVRLQPLPLLGAWASPPVERLPGERRGAADQLQRPVHPLPREHGTEHRPALDHLLPGPAQGRGVEPAAQGDDVLAQVRLRPGLQDGVEEHPLLHRGERVDVLDRPEELVRVLGSFGHS